VLLIALILAWQLLSGRVVSDYFISNPVAIAERLWEWGANGTLLRHLTSTLIITLSGFLIASFVAIALALVVSSFSVLDSILSPFIYAAYSMPKIVLGPALVLWLGIGLLPAIALSTLTAFFLVFFNVYTGLKSIPQIYGITARLLGASPIQTAFKFRLPAAAPYVVVGLNQGLIYAFHGAMVGELTASNVGMGYLILFSGSRLDATGVMSGLIVVGVISTLIVLTLEHLGRNFTVSDDGATGAPA
jgi:NitT/TauT family transport system permease protein